MEKKSTSEELFVAGRWREFLESLSAGTEDWTFRSYKDIMNVRVVASRLNHREDYPRKYRIKSSRKEDLKVFIEVSCKK